MYRFYLLRALLLLLCTLYCHSLLFIAVVVIAVVIMRRCELCATHRAAFAAAARALSSTGRVVFGHVDALEVKGLIKI